VASGSPNPVSTTFSPDSVKVHTLSRDGSRGIVHASAPPGTRFASGDAAPGRECSVTGSAGTDPVNYTITCPQLGKKLFSTITYGDYDYSFEEVLP
jgi:hypothetical protein